MIPMLWKAPLRGLHGIPKANASLRVAQARILVLEDENRVREVLAECLSRQGYQVLTGSSLGDALGFLGSLGWDQVDLVVTDTHLGRDPDIRDGQAFHDRWRALYPVPPFIFMDGWGRPLDQVHTSDRSCQVYLLAKPFPLSHLLGLIRAVLGR
jgi:DNA-binding response OmpR family regulator